MCVGWCFGGPEFAELGEVWGRLVDCDGSVAGEEGLDVCGGGHFCCLSWGLSACSLSVLWAVLELLKTDLKLARLLQGFYVFMGAYREGGPAAGTSEDSVTA